MNLNPLNFFGSKILKITGRWPSGQPVKTTYFIQVLKDKVPKGRVSNICRWLPLPEQDFSARGYKMKTELPFISPLIIRIGLNANTENRPPMCYSIMLWVGQIRPGKPKLKAVHFHDLFLFLYPNSNFS